MTRLNPLNVGDGDEERRPGLRLPLKGTVTQAMESWAYHGAILNALSREGQLPLLINLSDLRDTSADESYIVTFFVDDPDGWPVPYYTVPCDSEASAWDFAWHFEAILKPRERPTMTRFTGAQPKTVEMTIGPNRE